MGTDTGIDADSSEIVVYVDPHRHSLMLGESVGES